MDFSFTDEQQELRRAVRDVAEDRGTPARLREVIDSDSGSDAELWRLLAGELGLVGIAVPEAAGGLGGSFVDLAVALEEAGRALLPVPLMSSAVAAAVIARGSGGAAADAAVAERLGPIISGESVAAIGVVSDDVGAGSELRGSVPHVLDGHLADVVVLAAPDGLWLLDVAQPAVSVVPNRSLDLSRRQATITLESAAATRLGDASAAATAVDLLRVALAVESVGVARRCLELAVNHLKTRVQFGKPIGSFQALQHRAADLAVTLEAATSTAYYAAWAAADSPDELPVLAPLALAVCSDAAYSIAADAIQLHGGVGFTWEYDVHLYFKRATATRLLLGDTHVQRAVVAQRAGLRG